MLLISSCSKDKSSVENTGKLTYNGITYDITKGFKFVYNNQTEGDIDAEVVFSAETFDFSSNWEEVGYGAYFSVEFFDLSNTDILGTFDYYDSDHSGPELGDVRFWPERTIDTRYRMEAGHMNITKSGSTYSVSFTGLSAEGKELTFEFKGVFKIDELLVE